jgi:WD40 repeat protein
MHIPTSCCGAVRTVPYLLLAIFSTIHPLAAQEPRLRTVLGDGHPGSARSLIWSPDGKLLAAQDLDRTVRLWDVTSSSNYATFADPVSKVAAMRFMPDSQTLTLASLDGTMRSLDTATGKVKVAGKLPIEKAIHLALSPDRKLLAARGEDNVVRLWDVETAKEKRNFMVGDSRSDLLAFSADGAVVIVGSTYRSQQDIAVLHDAATGKMRSEIVRVRPAPAFSDDGKTWAAASPGRNDLCQVRELSTGKVIHVPGTDPRHVGALALSPDSKFLAVGIAQREAGFNDYSSSVITLINLASGEPRELRTIGHAGQVCVAAVFSPDGKSLAASYSQSGIHIWGTHSLQETARLKKWDQPIRSLVISPDGKLLAASGPAILRHLSSNTIPTVRLFDLTTSKRIALLENCSEPAFSPDGTFLVLKEPGAIKLWKVADRQWHETLKGDATCFAFSPDSKTLAIGLNRDRVITFWDVASGKKSATLTGHTGSLRALAFSPDGKLLASAAGDVGGERSLRLWDLATNKVLATLEGQKVFGTHVAFSPNGKILASIEADRTVYLWDVATGKPIGMPVRGGRFPSNVTFSPDSTLVAITGDSNGRILLHETATGTLAGTLTGHPNKVDRPIFTPDGKALISAGDDPSVRLWDVADRKQLVLVTGYSTVALSHDGRVLAIGSVTISILDLTPRPRAAP